MTDENRAKIREALTWMDHFAKRQCDGTIEHVANEALDALVLLDAEDTPSVPIFEEAADRAIKFEKQFTKNLDPVISDAYFAELRAAIIGKGGMT